MTLVCTERACTSPIHRNAGSHIYRRYSGQLPVCWRMSGRDGWSRNKDGAAPCWRQLPTLLIRWASWLSSCSHLFQTPLCLSSSAACCWRLHVSNRAFKSAAQVVISLSVLFAQSHKNTCVPYFLRNMLKTSTQKSSSLDGWLIA